MAALLSAGNGRQMPGGESPAGTENLSGRFSERSGQRIFQTVKRKTIAKGQKAGRAGNALASDGGGSSDLLYHIAGKIDTA